MANEKRLIDANLLSECLLELEVDGGHWLYRKACDEMIQGFFPKIINEQPTVDAVEVVHGRWEKAHIAGYLKCNCCNDAFIYEEWLKNGKWNYCPNCGAKMDGERKDNGNSREN